MARPTSPYFSSLMPSSYAVERIRDPFLEASIEAQKAASEAGGYMPLNPLPELAGLPTLQELSYLQAPGVPQAFDEGGPVIPPYEWSDYFLPAPPFESDGDFSDRPYPWPEWSSRPNYPWADYLDVPREFWPVYFPWLYFYPQDIGLIGGDTGEYDWDFGPVDPYEPPDGEEPPDDEEPPGGGGGDDDDDGGGWDWPDDEPDVVPWTRGHGVPTIDEIMYGYPDEEPFKYDGDEYSLQEYLRTYGAFPENVNIQEMYDTENVPLWNFELDENQVYIPLTPENEETKIKRFEKAYNEALKNPAEWQQIIQNQTGGARNATLYRYPEGYDPDPYMVLSSTRSTRSPTTESATNDITASGVPEAESEGEVEIDDLKINPTESEWMNTLFDAATQQGFGVDVMTGNLIQSGLVRPGVDPRPSGEKKYLSPDGTLYSERDLLDFYAKNTLGANGFEYNPYQFPSYTQGVGVDYGTGVIPEDWDQSADLGVGAAEAVSGINIEDALMAFTDGPGTLLEGKPVMEQDPLPPGAAEAGKRGQEAILKNALDAFGKRLGIELDYDAPIPRIYSDYASNQLYESTAKAAEEEYQKALAEYYTKGAVGPIPDPDDYNPTNEQLLDAAKRAGLLDENGVWTSQSGTTIYTEGKPILVKPDPEDPKTWRWELPTREQEVKNIPIYYGPTSFLEPSQTFDPDSYIYQTPEPFPDAGDPSGNYGQNVPQGNVIYDRARDQFIRVPPEVMNYGTPDDLMGFIADPDAYTMDDWPSNPAQELEDYYNLNQPSRVEKVLNITDNFPSYPTPLIDLGTDPDFFSIPLHLSPPPTMDEREASLAAGTLIADASDPFGENLQDLFNRYDNQAEEELLESLGLNNAVKIWNQTINAARAGQYATQGPSPQNPGAVPPGMNPAAYLLDLWTPKSPFGIELIVPPDPFLNTYPDPDWGPVNNYIDQYQVADASGLTPHALIGKSQVEFDPITQLETTTGPLPDTTTFNRLYNQEDPSVIGTSEYDIDFLDTVPSYENTLRQIGEFYGIPEGSPISKQLMSNFRDYVVKGEEILGDESQSRRVPLIESANVGRNYYLDQAWDMPISEYGPMDPITMNVVKPQPNPIKNLADMIPDFEVEPTTSAPQTTGEVKPVQNPTPPREIVMPRSRPDIITTERPSSPSFTPTERPTGERIPGAGIPEPYTLFPDYQFPEEVQDWGVPDTGPIIAGSAAGRIKQLEGELYPPSTGATAPLLTPKEIEDLKKQLTSPPNPLTQEDIISLEEIDQDLFKSIAANSAQSIYPTFDDIIYDPFTTATSPKIVPEIPAISPLDEIRGPVTTTTSLTELGTTPAVSVGSSPATTVPSTPIDLVTPATQRGQISQSQLGTAGAESLFPAALGVPEVQGPQQKSYAAMGPLNTVTPIDEVTVKPGDTLYKLAQDYVERHNLPNSMVPRVVDVMQTERANKDLIYPGEVVTYPDIASIKPENMTDFGSYIPSGLNPLDMRNRTNPPMMQDELRLYGADIDPTNLIPRPNPIRADLNTTIQDFGGTKYPTGPTDPEQFRNWDLLTDPKGPYLQIAQSGASLGTPGQAQGFGGQSVPPSSQIPSGIPTDDFWSYMTNPNTELPNLGIGDSFFTGFATPANPMEGSAEILGTQFPPSGLSSTPGNLLDQGDIISEFMKAPWGGVPGFGYQEPQNIPPTPSFNMDYYDPKPYMVSPQYLSSAPATRGIASPVSSRMPGIDSILRTAQDMFRSVSDVATGFVSSANAGYDVGNVQSTGDTYKSYGSTPKSGLTSGYPRSYSDSGDGGSSYYSSGGGGGGAYSYSTPSGGTGYGGSQTDSYSDSSGNYVSTSSYENLRSDSRSSDGRDSSSSSGGSSSGGSSSSSGGSSSGATGHSGGQSDWDSPGAGGSGWESHYGEDV